MNPIPEPRLCKLPRDHPARPQRTKVDLRSPLRRAVEEGDYEAILAAIHSDSLVVASGCWEWQRRFTDDCYPVARLGRRDVMVHRLSLEASLRRPLGRQAAHHACANTFCVNPDHLQPVTAAANMAEMLARTYMVQRIRDLESALASIDPTHPALAEVSLDHPGA